MYPSILELLTAGHREKLHEFGIDRQLLCHWRSGRRMPTEVQVVALAEVLGVDRHKLQDEIALLRATPEQRTLLLRVMGKLKRGASSLRQWVR